MFMNRSYTGQIFIDRPVLPYYTAPWILGKGGATVMKRIIALVLVVCAFAVGLTACGGDNASTPSTGAAVSTPAK